MLRLLVSTLFMIAGWFILFRSIRYKEDLFKVSLGGFLLIIGSYIGR